MRARGSLWTFWTQGQTNAQPPTWGSDEKPCWRIEIHYHDQWLGVETAGHDNGFCGAPRDEAHPGSVVMFGTIVMITMREWSRPVRQPRPPVSAEAGQRRGPGQAPTLGWFVLSRMVRPLPAPHSHSKWWLTPKLRIVQYLYERLLFSNGARPVIIKRQ